MQLNSLQKNFTHAICENNSLQELIHKIDSTKTLNAEQRLGIYRNNVNNVLLKTLKAVFPVCQKLVGDDFFTAMSRQYISTHASHSPDLNHYGEKFPEFINTFPPAKDLPYLSDVAQLEWCYEQTFYGPDTEILDVTALERVQETHSDQIAFQPPANGYVIASKFPVHKIWQSNQDYFTGDDVVELDEGAVSLLIWRSHYDMRMDIVTKTQQRLLSCFYQGMCLQEICDQSELGDIDLATELPVFMRRGYLQGFTLRT